MGYLKEIFKGIMIGVANIIPGVSGGTIALSMGIYEKILGAVNNIWKDFKGSIKTLLPYGIGLVLGIVCFAFIINFCLNNFNIPTLFAFIGLILGGLPSIYKRVKGEKFKPTHLITLAIMASLIIVPTIVTADMAETLKVVEFSFVSVLVFIVLGIISAGTMIVPGVSGSMMLMMLGYYETIMETIELFVKSALALDFASILSTIQILIPFGIGIVLGVVIIAKIIEKLLKKYPNATMWGIIGLVVTSPFAILYGVSFAGISVITILASIIAAVAGFFVARKMGE